MPTKEIININLINLSYMVDINLANTDTSNLL